MAVYDGNSRLSRFHRLNLGVINCGLTHKYATQALTNIGEQGLRTLSTSDALRYNRTVKINAL